MGYPERLNLAKWLHIEQGFRISRQHTHGTDTYEAISVQRFTSRCESATRMPRACSRCWTEACAKMPSQQASRLFHGPSSLHKHSICSEWLNRRNSIQGLQSSLHSTKDRQEMPLPTEQVIGACMVAYSNGSMGHRADRCFGRDRDRQVMEKG